MTGESETTNIEQEARDIAKRVRWVVDKNYGHGMDTDAATKIISDALIAAEQRGFNAGVLSYAKVENAGI